MVLTIRRWRRRFFAVLDSEGVALFQSVVYVHVTLAGVYGILVSGSVPQAVAEAMSPAAEVVWLWLCVGAVICVAGKFCRRTLANAGLWMQLTGDLFAFGAFAGYVAAIVQTAWWGTVLFAVFAVAALAECVALLLVRDVRRIIQVERMSRG